MSTAKSAIQRVVDHLEGPAATSRALGGVPVYQEIQRWLARGWASPHHIFRLEPFLPIGVTVRDLFDDKARAKAPRKCAKRQERGRAIADAGDRRIVSFPRDEYRVPTQRADDPLRAGKGKKPIPRACDKPACGGGEGR